MPEESKKVFKASENAKPLTVKRKKKVKPVAEKAAPVDEVPQEQADAEKAIAPAKKRTKKSVPLKDAPVESSPAAEAPKEVAEAAPKAEKLPDKPEKLPRKSHPLIPAPPPEPEVVQEAPVPTNEPHPRTEELSDEDSTAPESDEDKAEEETPEEADDEISNNGEDEESHAEDSGSSSEEDDREDSGVELKDPRPVIDKIKDVPLQVPKLSEQASGDITETPAGPTNPTEVAPNEAPASLADLPGPDVPKGVTDQEAPDVANTDQGLSGIPDDQKPLKTADGNANLDSASKDLKSQQAPAEALHNVPDTQNAAQDATDKAGEATQPTSTLPDQIKENPAAAASDTLASFAQAFENSTVNEMGNIVDASGTIMGKVSGDLPSMIGKPIAPTGEIKDGDEVLGHISELFDVPGMGDVRLEQGADGKLQMARDREGQDHTAASGQGSGFTTNFTSRPLDGKAKEGAKKIELGSQAAEAAADGSPSDIFLDVKSTTEGISLTIRIPTVFMQKPEGSAA